MRAQWRQSPVVVLFAGAVTVVACAPVGRAHRGTPPQHVSSTTQSTKTIAPTTSAQPPPTTIPPVPAQPGWTVLSTVQSGVAIDERQFRTTDGALVTVVRFRVGQVRYDLHVGSRDPLANDASLGPDAQPAISADEAPHVLGAFNGGFQTSSGSGGFEVGGQVLVPLSAGLASLVIDSNGSAQVGAWGQDVPSAGEQVASVRQNLSPLVEAGQPSPQVNDSPAWGATLGGGSYVARSALGEDSQGDLLYAASMWAVPADLATALIQSSVLRAMELDINPEWVQADTAPTPGAPLVAAVPGQNRPADQYQVGWTRDFVAVLSRS